MQSCNILTWFITKELTGSADLSKTAQTAQQFRVKFQSLQHVPGWCYMVGAAMVQCKGGGGVCTDLIAVFHTIPHPTRWLSVVIPLQKNLLQYVSNVGLPSQVTPRWPECLYLMQRWVAPSLIAQFLLYSWTTHFFSHVARGTEVASLSNGFGVSLKSGYWEMCNWNMGNILLYKSQGDKQELCISGTWPMIIGWKGDHWVYCFSYWNVLGQSYRDGCCSTALYFCMATWTWELTRLECWIRTWNTKVLISAQSWNSLDDLGQTPALSPITRLLWRWCFMMSLGSSGHCVIYWKPLGWSYSLYDWTV